MRSRSSTAVFRRRPMALAIATLFGSLPVTMVFAQDTQAIPEEVSPAVEQDVPPVVAEEAPEEGVDGIQEIFVTATRRDETVQDIPINITAVTGEMIQQQKLEDLADLVRTVPGLFLIDQGGRDANLLTVRGLNVSSLTASEGVGTQGGGVVAQYLGDIPLFIDLHLSDMERVEALLGPQGTLYGAGTLGGAIRYLPVRPQFGQTTLQVEAGGFAVGHSDGLGSEGTLIANLPLGERAALRASVGYLDDPGFIDYGFVLRQPGISNPEPDFNDPAAVEANLRKKKDANTQKTVFGRLGLRYAPTETIDGNLTYYFQNQDAGARTVAQVAAFDTGRYESANRFLEPNERKNQLLALEIDADFGFAKLTSATGISQYDEDGQRDQTDLLLSFEYGYEDFPSFAAFTREIAEEKRFNQELRLVSTDEGPFNWIAGAYYNDFDTDATSSEFVPGFPEFAGIDRPDNLEYLQATKQKFNERAIFGELGFDITDKLTLTVGGRWFKFKDDTSVGFALPLIDGSAPDEILLDAQPVKVSDKDAVFKFNTSYQFTESMLGYFTISEGYRTGGSNAVPACADPLPEGQNVCALPNERLITPDKTLNYELGFKSSLLGGRLIANGAVYVIQWDDIQVDGTTVNGEIPITVNAAEASSSGVELSTQALLSPHWSLSLNYAYNKAELTKDAPGIVSGEDAFDGDRLPGSPRHQGHATLGYTRPLPRGMMLNADYVISSQSDVYSRVGLRNFGESLGGYTVHDASVRVSKNQWGIRLYAKNLFDKYAETGVRSTTANVRAIDGPDNDEDTISDYSFRLRSYYKSVLNPLRVGVTLNYSFGS